MNRTAALFPIPLLLSACIAASPDREPVGKIEFAGQTYVLDQAPQGWQIRMPEGPVPCRAATERDCYWSLRAHLAAQAISDELG